MLIDSHLHLDARAFEHDRPAVIAAAQAAGVAGFVLMAVAPDNFQAVADLAHALPNTVYCLGIHPLYVAALEPVALQQLESAVGLALDRADARFAGIGEIGLDCYVPGFDWAAQEFFYYAQLKLARRFGLPVVLHSRRAQDLVLKGLRRHQLCGGIAHAFNGSAQQATAFIQLGFKLGFGGAASYAGSRNIRRLAASLPSDSIVLETDSPDMAPQWLDGGSGQPRARNTPAQLPAIAAEIAALRQVSSAVLIAQTGRNLAVALPALAGLVPGLAA